MGSVESSEARPIHIEVAGQPGQNNAQPPSIIISEPEPTMKSTALKLLDFSVKTFATLLVIQFGVKALEKVMDTTLGTKTTEATKKDLLSKKGAAGAKDGRSEENAKLKLNAYEVRIAQELIDPEDIDVDFSHIGGLQSQKDEVQGLVVDRFRNPELFGGSKLLGPPPGILLYGPPGTGKTMLAKAVAKESGATFLSINLSSLFDKFFGESQKLVRAIFSLAEKLSPTIVFIDEIDAFLRQRGSDDQRVLSTMKAEFMSLWDGMSSDGRNSARSSNGFGVVIIGASNRPRDIDPAFQRRLARKIFVGLPVARQRLQILRISMASDMHRLADFPANGALRGDSQSLPLAPAYFAELARDTEFYSGHDIKELCRVAVMAPVQECLTARRRAGATATPAVPRKVTKADFYDAMEKVFPHDDPTLELRRQEAEQESQGHEPQAAQGVAGGSNPASNPEFGALMQAILHSLARQQSSQRRGPPRHNQPPPFRPGTAGK